MNGRKATAGGYTEETVRRLLKPRADGYSEVELVNADVALVQRLWLRRDYDGMPTFDKLLCDALLGDSYEGC